MSDKAFLDTNVVVYLLSDDERKADISERLIATGGVVSVQVLNEFAAVATRKFNLTLPEIKTVLAAVRHSCEVLPLTAELHDLGLSLMERYGLSVYDAMIVAAALSRGASTLLSEDMQDGLIIDDCLKIVDPYAPGSL